MLVVRGTWMRGGTSKCWLFDAEEFAAAAASSGTGAERLLLAAFGAADPRQLDGVGGATSTTSKAALVGRSEHPDTDISYTFAQVGIGAETVEWGSNCGNCATAIGLYAVQHGLVPVTVPHTTVRMRDRNTGAVLSTTVPTPNGTPPQEGSGTVPGTTAAGVPVELTFEDPVGSTTGALLPTGNPADELTAAQLHTRATLVDAGAPAALLPAQPGWHPGTPSELTAHIGELTRLRRVAALAMGLAGPDGPVSHAVPKTGVVTPAADYRTTDGEPVCGAAYDLSVRMLSMHTPHPVIGLTSAVAVAAAAQLSGSVVWEALPAASPLRTAAGAGVPRTLRLGTPAGVVEVRLHQDVDGQLRAVSMTRAARLIAQAELHVPLPSGPASTTVAADAVPVG